MDFSTHLDRPFRVGFLLFDDFALIAYSSALSPLMVANELSGQELYNIRNLPASGAQAISSSGAVIKADAYPGEHVDFDLIIVVGGCITPEFDNPRILQWLRLLSRRNVMIGGISAGSVVLAKAGIMTERALYVFDRDRLTCTGDLASVDMMHALISDHHSPAFAREVSDYILHTNVRPGEGPQRSGLVERIGLITLPLLRSLKSCKII